MEVTQCHIGNIKVWVFSHSYSQIWDFVWQLYSSVASVVMEQNDAWNQYLIPLADDKSLFCLCFTKNKRTYFWVFGCKFQQKPDLSQNTIQWKWLIDTVGIYRNLCSATSVSVTVETILLRCGESDKNKNFENNNFVKWLNTTNFLDTYCMSYSVFLNMASMILAYGVFRVLQTLLPSIVALMNLHTSKTIILHWQCTPPTLSTDCSFMAPVLWRSCLMNLSI